MYRRSHSQVTLIWGEGGDDGPAARAAGTAGRSRGDHRRGGLRRDGGGHRVRQARDRRHRDPGARRRSRRHLARQSLPGPGRRHRLGDLLVLIRTQPELVATVRAGRRAQGVRRARRRRLRPARPHGVRGRGGASRMGRRRRSLDGPHRIRRRSHGAVPGDRDRLPLAAAHPGLPRHGLLRGRGHPHHRLAGRLRLRGQAGRRHRDRGDRGPVDPRDRPHRKGTHRVPAHADLGGAEDRLPDPARGIGGSSPGFR